MKLRHKVPIRAIEEARRNAPVEPMSERYRDVALTCKMRADRAEYELADRLEAVAKLIPEAARPDDLEEHYRRHVEREVRQAAEVARLEDIRSAVIQRVWELEQIGRERLTADILWQVLQGLHDEAAGRRKSKPAKKAEPAIEQPSLLDGAA